MNLFDEKINNIAVVEYMYQFNVAKCIKNGNLDDLELKEKIKDFTDRAVILEDMETYTF